jgi:hypothetical protein
MVESDRLRRLRWRLRGAWQWPVFAVLTVVDAVLITQLPFQGDGPNALGAAWVATAANLFAVALLAPPASALVRRFRRDLPWMIARDYAGTGLLVLTSFVLLAGGLIHRSAVLAERADQRAMVSAVHDYVLTSEPKFAPGLGSIDAMRLEPEHYRACVYGSERLPICLLVNTDQTPAGVQRDPSRDPNAALSR